MSDTTVNTLAYLRSSLNTALKHLRDIPDPSIFGVNELASDVRSALRYLEKLEDHYLCPKCSRLNTTKPSVQYYKALWHEDCFLAIYGPERLAELKKVSNGD